MLVCGVGEVLWDIFPDKETFGGAALNFCANLQRLGDAATLVSAVGNDRLGHLALERMHLLGLDTMAVQRVEDLPTGTAAISTGPDGEPAFSIPRPAAFDAISPDPSTVALLVAAAPRWLYFGTLLQTNPCMERFTTELACKLRPAGTFYDMNLRPGHWNLPLVQRLSQLSTIVKMNEAEARMLHAHTQSGHRAFSLDAFCRIWASTYDVEIICITLGGSGCLIYAQEDVLLVPGFKVTVCDTVGSGDAFASAFLHGYSSGWTIAQTARFANALGAIVASRAGATPDWTMDEIAAITPAYTG
ncbi:MAG: carbohydrate kinase family protein [Acidobacteriota bacterium]